MTNELKTLPSYTYQATDDPHLFRVVDRNGDWLFYYNDEFQIYAPAVNAIIHGGFPTADGLIEWFKSLTKEEIEKISKGAKERGSRVHEAIRDMINGVEITPQWLYASENNDDKLTPLTHDEWDALTSWVKWAEKHQPRVYRHETSILVFIYEHIKTGKKIVGRDYVKLTPAQRKQYVVWGHYAGTIDFDGDILVFEKVDLTEEEKVQIKADAKLIGEKPSMKRTKEVAVRREALLDWKFASGIRDEMKVQTSMYERSRVRPADVTGIVRVGTAHTDGYEMKCWDQEETTKHFESAIASMVNYRLTHKPFDPGCIREIPQLLAVKIPLIEVPVVKGRVKKERKTNGNRTN